MSSASPRSKCGSAWSPVEWETPTPAPRCSDWPRCWTWRGPGSGFSFARTVPAPAVTRSRFRSPTPRPTRAAGRRWRTTSRDSATWANMASTCGPAGKSDLERRGDAMTNDVYIIGTGQTPVGEHWGLGMRELGSAAVAEAIADAIGLLPAEALKIEAACASGAAAVRAAFLAVASGAHQLAVAVGVEKMTDAPSDVVTSALATAADQDFEASHGLSFVALSALLMRRYLYETKQDRAAFAPFALLAHQNASTNPKAMFREPITAEQFLGSPMAAEPIGILDAAPVCDGAAAVVLCSKAMLRPHHRPVRVASSSVATDTIALAARPDILALRAAARSASRAFAAARCTPQDID